MTDEQLDAKFQQLIDMIDANQRVNAAEFERITGRFDKIDGRFAKIDDRFTRLEAKMDKGFEDVNLRIDSLERKLDAEVSWRDHADRRITRLEKHQGLPPLEP